MMFKSRLVPLLLFLFILICIHVRSQDSTTRPTGPSTSTTVATSDTAKPTGRDTTTRHRLHLFSGTEQVDVLDILASIFLRHPKPRLDSAVKKPGHVYAGLLPSAEYTLQTALAIDLVGNLAFYTSNEQKENISSIYLNGTITEKNQLLVPLQGNIWSKGNKYNLINDWRYEIYPQDTYGLGSQTKASNGYGIDFTYWRFYTTLLKTIAPDFYVGLGYDLDYFFNVEEINPPAGGTDFERYGISPTSWSSGPTFNILYDGRRNSINPEPGYYASIIYRPNFRFLGSDSNWQSLQIDARAYKHFPAGSNNTIAFWTYDVFTLQGHPPYLMLPANASDTYSNSGRGYVQDRFRGKDMLYLESEYRFGITSNGLLGGVVFVNAGSFSEPTNNRFEAINPGWGAGIRIKLNKFSKTNICLDYGFGLNGSGGIFANLGEVF
jgi:hypothetical protein